MFYGDNLDPKEAILMRLHSGKSLDDIRRELKSKASESFIEMQINNTRDYLIKGLLYMGVEEEELITDVEEWGFNIDNDSVEEVKYMARSVREVKEAINVNVFKNLDSCELEKRLGFVDKNLSQSEYNYNLEMRDWIRKAGTVACVYNLLNFNNDVEILETAFQDLGGNLFRDADKEEAISLALSLREHPIFLKRRFDSNAWRDFVSLDRNNLQTNLRKISGGYSGSSSTKVYNFPTNGVTSSNGKAAIGAVGNTSLEQMVEATSQDFELGERDLDTAEEVKAVCEEEIPSYEGDKVDSNGLSYSSDVVDEDRPVISLGDILEGDESRKFNMPPERKKTKWGAFFAGAAVALTSFGVGLAIQNYAQEKNESRAPGYIADLLNPGQAGNEKILTDDKTIELPPQTNPHVEQTTLNVGEYQPVSEQLMEEIRPNQEVNNNETFIIDGERLIINPEPGYGLTVYANLLPDSGWQELSSLNSDEINSTLDVSRKEISKSTYNDINQMLSISQQIAEMNPSSVSNVDFSSYQAVRSGLKNVIRTDKSLVINISDLDFSSSLNLPSGNAEDYGDGVNEVNLEVQQSDNTGFVGVSTSTPSEKNRLTMGDIIKEQITRSYVPDQALDSVVTKHFNGSSSGSDQSLEKVIGSDGSYDERNDLEVCLDDYLELSRSQQGYHNSKMFVLSELVGRLSKGESTDDTWARLSYEEAQDLAVDLYIYGDGYSVSSGLNPSTFISVNNIVTFLDSVTEGGFKKKELNQTLNEREIQRRNFKESRKAYNAWQSWQRDLRKEEAYNTLMESGNLPGLVSDDKSYAAMQDIADKFGFTVDTVKKYVKEYSMDVPDRDFNSLV